MGAPPAGSIKNPRRPTKWRWWNAREVQYFTPPQEEVRKPWELAPDTEPAPNSFQGEQEHRLPVRTPVGEVRTLPRPAELMTEEDDVETEGPVLKRRRVAVAGPGFDGSVESGSRTPAEARLQTSLKHPAPAVDLRTKASNGSNRNPRRKHNNEHKNQLQRVSLYYLCLDSFKAAPASAKVDSKCLRHGSDDFC
ncbi:hypothetical protein KFL_000610390 [Klebsormidium nitens]|uniref:Uncharacterized protein n=1 Tax=Klebsormidium nitens TaxID=105231 RepID=A0A0U9HS21_KLENI|nr:hypothetical protein KFL_000610390 [Klebsormidium nitens]|eukprot:GAQ80761.1 hypothetical protein KFL_000610390 [Klebsormidium nitens]